MDFIWKYIKGKYFLRILEIYKWTKTTFIFNISVLGLKRLKLKDDWRFPAL